MNLWLSSGLKTAAHKKEFRRNSVQLKNTHTQQPIKRNHLLHKITGLLIYSRSYYTFSLSTAQIARADTIYWTVDSIYWLYLYSIRTVYQLWQYYENMCVSGCYRFRFTTRYDNQKDTETIWLTSWKYVWCRSFVFELDKFAECMSQSARCVLHQLFYYALTADGEWGLPAVCLRACMHATSCMYCRLCTGHVQESASCFRLSKRFQFFRLLCRIHT